MCYFQVMHIGVFDHLCIFLTLIFFFPIRPLTELFVVVGRPSSPTSTVSRSRLSRQPRRHHLHLRQRRSISTTLFWLSFSRSKCTMTSNLLSYTVCMDHVFMLDIPACIKVNSAPNWDYYTWSGSLKPACGSFC